MNDSFNLNRNWSNITIIDGQDYLEYLDIHQQERETDESH